MNTLLDASYAHCRATARSSGSSFYLAFLLLPAAKRRAMYALYAFLRKTDDLVDGDPPSGDRRDTLSAWRAELKTVLGESNDWFSNDGQQGDSIFPALVDTVRRFEIPPQYLLAVIDGVEMDLEPRRFATFDELEHYCHLVASAVGLACLHIWGFHGGEIALRHARVSGVAFQMTNILRDVREDAQRGRVYLPTKDLEQFDCAPNDLCGADFPDRLRRLMSFEIERVRELYREAAELRPFLSRGGRRAFGAMLDIYQRLLTEIERRDGEVFSRRVRVGRWRRAAIVARHAFSAARPEAPQLIRPPSDAKTPRKKDRR